MFNFFIQKLLNNKIQLEIDKKQEELNTINLQLQIYKKELDETINLLGTNKGLIEKKRNFSKFVKKYRFNH